MIRWRTQFNEQGLLCQPDLYFSNDVIILGKWLFRFELISWKNDSTYFSGAGEDCVINMCCSVTKSCPTLCHSMDCSPPGFPVFYHLPELAQTHVHWVSDVIQPSHSLLCRPLLLLPFSVVWLFASGGRSIIASASASVLPMNIQGWFPLGLTGLINM